MFCPEGYLTLLEIYEMLFEAGHNYARENVPPLFEKFPESGFHIDTGDELETKGRAYGEWLFQNFLSRFSGDLCASQNTGVVVRLAPSITMSTKVFNGPFPDSLHGQKTLIEHVRDGLGWIDQSNFQISAIKPLATFGGDDDDYGLNGMATALKPIDGWLVCWKPPKWPSRGADLVLLCTDWQLDSPDGILTVPQKAITRGRPPKGDGMIRRAVQNEFLHLLKKGVLPTDQRESINSLVIEWVERVFEQRIGRTTAQQYLAPVLEVLDARK